MTCIALALASTRTFDRILPPDRLDETDEEGNHGGLNGLELDEPGLLRGARRLGWLKDRDAHGTAYIDRLIDAREELLDITRRLHQEREAGEDCSAIYTELLQHAHGLAGVIVHLLDLAGVEVIWQVRLPEFSRNYDADRRSQLTTMVTTAIGICSRYGQIATYPHLLEERPEQRTAIQPAIDATDPYAELIPSIAIVGPGVSQLESRLEQGLTTREPHEDAPEVAIRVPIHDRTQDRTAYAQATQIMCRAKDLRPNRTAVSLLQAVCGSPVDAAEALGNLGAEQNDPGQVVRAHDLRYALSTLAPRQLLPDLPPTVGQIIAALLNVERRISQSTLAKRANVSTRSIRENHTLLETLGLIDVTDAGYRLRCSFRDERREDVLPDLMTDGTTTLADVTFELLAIILEDIDRLANPNDPIGGCLFWLPDCVTVCDRCPAVAPWISVGAALLGESENIAPQDITVATLGPSIDQTSLLSAAQGTPSP